MKHYYTTSGTCSRSIEIETEGDVIRNVKFVGGCSGNIQGICHLVEGMNASEVVKRLEGMQCGLRGTSCPDQLSKALREMGY